MNVIDRFEIPEELGLELTELLAKQVINDRILSSVADQPEKYQTVMNAQIDIQRNIDRIKWLITEQYVPDCYSSDRYSWNYNGYDIAANKVEIIEN